MQMNNGLPFWRHPANGWSAETRGLSETQLDQWETAIGAALPLRFRQLMAEQNGGQLRCPALHLEAGGPWEISIDVAPLAAEAVQTVRDLALMSLGDKQLARVCSQLAPCYPERAVLISRLHGHECLVLDYGWRQEQARAVPRVAILTDNGEAFPYEEIWSVADFDSFLEQLCPMESDGRRILGLHCSQPFEKIAEVFADWLSTEGPESVRWAAEELGFRGAVPLQINSEIESDYCRQYDIAPQELADWLGAEGRRRWTSARLSPNQFSDGAWHFPERTDLTAFIEIASTWFEIGPALPGLRSEVLALKGLDCSDVVKLPV